VFRSGQPRRSAAPGKRARVEQPRELGETRVGLDDTPPAGAALDALAAAVFSGERGRARLTPLFERFEAEVEKIAGDDVEFELLQLVRMDWALCDATIGGASPGETWAWRAIHGEIPGFVASPSSRYAARSISSLFEVFPGEPTWVRDRLSGVVLRLFDSIGPWPHAEPEHAAALWELRLVPDPSGGFHVARPPIDYPPDLLELLDHEFSRRFAAQRWPSMQALRRARVRFHRAGGRTPITRMLQWR
jgi:hypothetical protein